MGRTRWAFVVVTAVVVGLALFLSATRFWARTPRTITIGAISPFSGDGAIYGDAARTGIDLAVNEINAAGGVNGDKLTVLYEDDHGVPTGAVSALNKLISIDKSTAVLGPFYSGNVLAVAPVANRANVVIISGSATSDNIRTAGPFIFRVCPSNDEQARTIAQFARSKLHRKSAFIIYRNDDYGVTLRAAFEKSFPALGGTILGAEAVPPDASDVRAQLSRVQTTNPDLIFAAVHVPEGAALLRQSRELGIKATIMGTDGGQDPQLLQIAGDAAEGSYWVTIGWANGETDPSVARFRNAYRARYGKDPGVYSALYYDAAEVLAKAIELAPSTSGPNIQKALFRVDYVGPTGRTKFDRTGGVSKPFEIYRVQSGQFKPILQ
jgi:branched-chain amino acid transport system substrate-binding protein